MYVYLSHTVLSVATRNVPGMEIPAPPPIVIPFKRATWKKYKLVQVTWKADIKHYYCIM